MKSKCALVVAFAYSACYLQAQLPPPDKIPTRNKEVLLIQPIQHASLVLSYNNKTVYVDPAGDGAAFDGLPDPDLILITDFTKDHLDLKTLESIHTANAIFVVPQAVADRLPESLIKKGLIVFENGDRNLLNKIGVAAIPRYNLPETNTAFYIRGRGNGYVIGMGGKNIYISGETDSIPEIKELKSIDIAFISMNLPHTMNAREAAETVLAFKPLIVYPYQCAASDMASFQTILNDLDKTIDVRNRNWYPEGIATGLKTP